MENLNKKYATLDRYTTELQVEMEKLIKQKQQQYQRLANEIDNKMKAVIKEKTEVTQLLKAVKNEKGFTSRQIMKLVKETFGENSVEFKKLLEFAVTEKPYTYHFAKRFKVSESNSSERVLVQRADSNSVDIVKGSTIAGKLFLVKFLELVLKDYAKEQAFLVNQFEKIKPYSILG